MLTITHQGKAGSRPDPNIWRHQAGYAGNNEMQVYTAAGKGNAYNDGEGHLVIEAKQEPTTATNVPGRTFDYSSARLDTKGLLKIQPGSRVEIQAKLPSGPGCWPALWGVGSLQFTDPKFSWPRAGEFDGIEVAGGWRPKTMLVNAHAPYYDNKLAEIAAAEGTTVEALQALNRHYETGWIPPNFVNLTEEVGANWHTYAWDFDGNGLRWFLDNKVVKTVYKADFDKVGAQWPWNKSMDLIVNLAIRDWGDGPDKTHAIDGVWPQKMYLGQIRIGQFAEFA